MILTDEITDQAIRETQTRGAAQCIYSAERTPVRIYARGLGPASDAVLGAIRRDDDAWYAAQWDAEGQSIDGESPALIPVPQYWVVEFDADGLAVGVLPLNRHLAMPERAECRYLVLEPVAGAPSARALAQSLGLELEDG